MTNIDHIINDLYKIVEADNEQCEKHASVAQSMVSSLGQSILDVAEKIREQAGEDND